MDALVLTKLLTLLVKRSVGNNTKIQSNAGSSRFELHFPSRIFETECFIGFLMHIYLIREISTYWWEERKIMYLLAQNGVEYFFLSS